MGTAFLEKLDKTQDPITIILWIICFLQVYSSDTPSLLDVAIRLVFWVSTFALFVKVEKDWNNLRQTKKSHKIEEEMKASPS